KEAVLPIGEKVMPATYLSGEGMEIPDALLMTDLKEESARKGKTEAVLSYEKAMEQRMQLMGLTGTEVPKENGIASLTHASQVELIRFQIATCDHAAALYSIFILESEGVEGLDALKGMAWLGVV